MIIVCASCDAKNRVPEEKLTAQPSCGQCHQPLLPLEPIELNEQNHRSCSNERSITRA